MSNQSPRIPGIRETTRFPIELSDAMRARMMVLQDVLRLKALSDVVRRGVSVLDDLVQAQERGATILIREPDGTIAEKRIE